MKVLFLVENIQKISEIIRKNNNLKVIDEFELVEDTHFKYSFVQPGYSNFIVNRASTFSKIWRYQKTLCLILDQRHNCIDKIPHDVSIRIYENLIPKRLSHSCNYQVDKLYNENEFNFEKLIADYNLIETGSKQTIKF
jgi:hypothetical protein